MRKIDYPGGFISMANLPALTTPVDGGTLVSMTFSEDWLPYVLGALVVLSRPETWNADGADLDAVLLEADYLLTLWDDGPTGAPLPINWLLTQHLNHGRLTQFSRFPDVGIPDDQAEYICNIEPDLGIQPDIKIMGFVLGSPTLPAGGKFAKLLILPAIVGSVAAATIELEDLFGVVSSDTQILPINMANLHLRSVRVIGTGPLQIQLTIAGPYEVGPA